MHSKNEQKIVDIFFIKVVFLNFFTFLATTGTSSVALVVVAGGAPVSIPSSVSELLTGFSCL